MVPTVTVTDTPPSDPVSPEIVNPAAFSAMLIVPSPAIATTFSTRLPALCTGVAAISVLPSPPPTEFTARTWKVYIVSLVSPVTVKLSSLAPLGALSGIAVHPP